MGGAHDLSGLWSGSYGYPPGTGPVTGFTCLLLDNDGELSGSTSERSESGGRERAVVQGRRAGHSVTFLKTYDGAGAYAHCVAYAGELDGDATTLIGRWKLERWTGPFVMSRPRPVTADRQEERGEPLPIGPVR